MNEYEFNTLCIKGNKIEYYVLECLNMEQAKYFRDKVLKASKKGEVKSTRIKRVKY